MLIRQCVFVFVELYMSMAPLVRFLILIIIDEWQNFSMGYKEFMHELFDENVLFLEGISESVATLHDIVI